MSSSCAIKRRRPNSTISTIFKNSKDEKQCISLIEVLNSCIQITMDRYILKEIAEYSTGTLFKCQHDLHKSTTSWIHHLSGNNFDTDKEENYYSNELLLFNYKCEDEKCSHEIHIFECKTCDKKLQINKLKPYDDIHPYRACTKGNCHGIYCQKCYSKGGFHCHACQDYYCNNCSKLSGGHCAHCSEYFCQLCAYFMNYKFNQDDVVQYCEHCRWTLDGAVSHLSQYIYNNKTVDS